MVIATIAEFLEPSFWDEADADYLPSGNNKMKLWKQWSAFLLLNRCSWVMIVGSASVKICWSWVHWKADLGV